MYYPYLAMGKGIVGKGVFRGRLGGLAAGVVLSLVSLGLCLGLLEVATRLSARVPPPLKVRHPVLDRVYHPHFQGDVFNREAGRAVPLRFNADGFRGGDLPREREAGARRIAILGDSMVAALAVEEEDTAAARLGSLLSDSHSDLAWEVQNFGVSGWGTASALAVYREVVADSEPDLVLATYFVGNDFSDNSSRLSRRPRIYFTLDEEGDLVRVNPTNIARKRGSDWLDQHSFFYRWWQGRSARLRRSVRKRSGNWIFCNATDERLTEAWNLSFRLLAKLQEEVEARGQTFAVVVLPSGEQIYDEPWERALELFGDRASCMDRDFPDRQLEAFAADTSMPLLVMTDAFRAAGSSPRADETPVDELLFFNGLGHFTRAGNRLAAEEIHRFLTTGQGTPLLEAVLEP